LVDLVWFDLSDPAQPVLAGRAEDFFPDALPYISNAYGYDYELCRKGIERGMMVTDWRLQKRARQNDHTGIYELGDSPTLSSPLLQATARMVVDGDYLYAIVNKYLHAVDLSGALPEKVQERVFLDNVGTFVAHQNQLYLGTAMGLAIYSLSDPQHPTYAAQIPPLFGCNPIAVANDRLYASTRSGNYCGQGSNALVVVDLRNSTQPQTLASYDLSYPNGLRVDDDGLLFVCDDGLKLFRVGPEQTTSAMPIGHFPTIHGYDVLPLGGHVLMVIAEDALYQCDYADGVLRLLSVIALKK
jgi:hypothetical protein